MLDGVVSPRPRCSSRRRRARGDDLDAVLLEVAEQVLGLLARELCLLDHRGHRLGGQESPLLTLG